MNSIAIKWLLLASAIIFLICAEIKLGRHQTAIAISYCLMGIGMAGWAIMMMVPPFRIKQQLTILSLAMMLAGSCSMFLFAL